MFEVVCGGPNGEPEQSCAPPAEKAGGQPKHSANPESKKNMK